jgi:YD repeat-containing protein
MDAKGNLVSSFTTRNKAVMSNVNLKYDGAGRITERKITGDFLVNNSVQSYSYYENGQISREERTINNESFISYYNPDGKLNKYTHGKKENPEYETTLYSFDNNGLIVKKEILKEGKRIFVENYVYEFYK